MEKEIVYSSETEEFLRDLVYLLFQNEYFGFEEEAKYYVDKITLFIEQNISNFPSKNSPEEFEKYGKKYIKFSDNLVCVF